MKDKLRTKNILWLVGALVLLSSCTARQKYERPADAVNGDLFRTDKLVLDSSSLATVSWREIFTDPVLQRHIQQGLENNLDIRLALQNITRAEAYLKQSKAAYQPTVAVGPSYTFQTQSLNTQLGQLGGGTRRYNDIFDLSGDVSLDLDIWGRMKAEERARTAEYFGSVATHQAVKSDLVAAIASAYYQLLTFDEQKRIIGETISLRRKNLETTRALKEAGTLTEVAVQQSEALVYNAESMLIDTNTQIELLENAMSYLLAVPSQRIERTTLAQQKMPANYKLGFPANLLANRPDVRASEYNLMSAFELTNAAKAQFYPTLRITGSGGLQSLAIDNLFSANSLFANVIGGLTQPILNKRQIRTNYEVSLANRESAYLNFRKTVLQAGREVSDALKVYEAQDQFIDLKRKELAAYRNSVEYSQELVNYGMANYLEVLNSSVNSLNAELNISNAEYNKMRAGVELYQALGGGWR